MLHTPCRKRGHRRSNATNNRGSCSFPGELEDKAKTTLPNAHSRKKKRNVQKSKTEDRTSEWVNTQLAMTFSNIDTGLHYDREQDVVDYPTSTDYQELLRGVDTSQMNDQKRIEEIIESTDPDGEEMRPYSPSILSGATVAPCIRETNTFKPVYTSNETDALMDQEVSDIMASGVVPMPVYKKPETAPRSASFDRPGHRWTCIDSKCDTTGVTELAIPTVDPRAILALPVQTIPTVHAKRKTTNTDKEEKKKRK